VKRDEMHTRPYSKKSRRNLAVVLSATFLLWFVGGCIGLEEIRNNLASTNEALLKTTVALDQVASNQAAIDQALLPAEMLPDGSGSKIEPWQEPSAKIDAYIAAHPDDKKTASALRVRQAMLLLAYEQYNLASASFDQATDLHSARDKALKALKDHLIWWFKVDKKTAPGSEVDAAIEAFAIQIDALGGEPGNEGIRDYLVEMRAWIQLYAAEHAITEETMAKELAGAMDNFAETLDEEDILAVNTGEIRSEPDPFGLKVRRQVRAMAVVARAAELAKSLKGTGVTVPYTEENARKIKAINFDD
jgi:hypothetical protein